MFSKQPALSTTYGWNIVCDNVNEALPIGLELVRTASVLRTSRGIDFLEVPGPVTTLYRSPERRVLFDEVRDANPFFHLMESLWIIGGSNKLALPQYYLARYADFSDDGVTLHGAYGYRLRRWQINEEEYIDQLSVLIDLLRNKPDTRQAVMSIWNPDLDLGVITKDMPCNDMLMFSIRDGYLHMQVCNRSNDVIWGAYGANVVQFSMLHELIAAAVGVNVGYYTQQSWSYHVYPTNPFWQKFLADEHQNGLVHNEYMNPDVHTYALAATPAEALEFIKDCEELCRRFESADTKIKPFSTLYFNSVVVPLTRAYEYYKMKDWDAALEYANRIAAPDWRVACVQWIMRRMHKALEKQS